MNIDSVQLSSTSTANATQDKKLKKACKDFEAIFLNNLLKSMRKTIVKSDLFGSNQQEEMFQDMMDSETCSAISKQNSIGIADMLYRQMCSSVEQDETSANDTRGTR